MFNTITMIIYNVKVQSILETYSHPKDCMMYNYCKFIQLIAWPEILRYWTDKKHHSFISLIGQNEYKLKNSILLVYYILTGLFHDLIKSDTSSSMLKVTHAK